MSEKSTIKKIEIVAIAAALVAVGVLSGYFIGRGVGPKVVTVKVPETVETTVPETGEPVRESDNIDDMNIIKKININTADVDELCELPGIGEVLSERIITYRKERGKFSSVEDILNVYGIGTSTYEAIKDFIFT